MAKRPISLRGLLELIPDAWEKKILGAAGGLSKKGVETLSAIIIRKHIKKVREMVKTKLTEAGASIDKIEEATKTVNLAKWIKENPLEALLGLELGYSGIMALLESASEQAEGQDKSNDDMSTDSNEMLTKDLSVLDKIKRYTEDLTGVDLFDDDYAPGEETDVDLNSYDAGIDLMDSDQRIEVPDMSQKEALNFLDGLTGSRKGSLKLYKALKALLND